MTVSSGSNREMAATLKISIGFAIAMPMISSVLIRCCIIKEIRAISINAKRNIHTKKEMPNAISDDFTIEEMKKAIPKKVELIAKSKPV